MDKRLSDYLSDRQVNYVTPFLDLYGEERRTFRPSQMVRRIYEDGSRSLLITSQGHPEFCREGWWQDMREVLSTARELGMKVWLQDAKHYPTGYVSGFDKNHPELRLFNLAENHTDVIGPVSEGMVMLEKYTPEDEIVAVYAYRRLSKDQSFLGDKPICLTDKVDGNVVWVDLPEGVWRVMAFYKTHKAVSDSFISVIDDASVQVLIDEVYEPHYRELAEFMGNTFVGFFSDEPRYRNQMLPAIRKDYGYYHRTVGMPYVGMPWNDEAELEMQRELECEAKPLLAALWYNVEGVTDRVRLAYMNAVSYMYGKHFCTKLGNWCRDHGLSYIGHIEEDMGCHARLGNGCAHFFRCQDGQDMSGIDIVLHQVIPGFAHYDNRSKDAYQITDVGLNHYILCQLAASSSHINPQMAGRAMCECFCAYGWAEDVPMMKWIIDFMLVRGINRFMPNSYTETLNCEQDGCQVGLRTDPQLPGFRKLVKYANKLAHLMSDGTHIANAAILYHAELEWMNGSDYTDMAIPAKYLFDSQISYDLLPVDALCNVCSVKDLKLSMADEQYDALFIPFAKRIPERLIRVLGEFCDKGLPVYFVGGMPDGCDGIGEVISAERIPSLMREKGFYDISVDGEYPMLRQYHIRRGKADVYFLFNEDVGESVNTNVGFSQRGICTVIDNEGERVRSVESADGVVPLSLAPYESAVIMWNAANSADTVSLAESYTSVYPELTYSIETASYESMDEYKYLTTTSELFNITGRSHDPYFSGRIRYTTALTLESAGEYILDLGAVGQIASVRVNGVDCGLRMCSPYRFDISSAVTEGENTLEITVSNTLVYNKRDAVSPPIIIPPSGLLGRVRLLSPQKTVSE